MKKQIATILDESEFDFYGLRVMTPSPYTKNIPLAKVGEILPNSYVWEDGDPTDEEIDGVSAIAINGDNIDDIIEQTSNYTGQQIVLAGGFDAEGGEDRGEIIIRNGVALAVWSK